MLKLEIFETSDPADRAAYLDPQSAAKLRDTAYEQGYAAGWQDAHEHLRDADALHRTATHDAIQAISFTYEEARTMTESQLSTVIDTILTNILPQVYALSLPALVAQEVRVLLARDTSATLALLCAPQSAPLLASVLADLPAAAHVSLIEEPSFAPAQVVVKGHDHQREIDLSSVATLLQTAMGAAPDIRTTLPKGAHNG